MSIVHRLAKAVDEQKPGTVLKPVWLDAPDMSAIFLDGGMVRPYYGEAAEKYVEAAHTAAHWLAEDLASQEGPGKVTPIAIMETLHQAWFGFSIDDAMRINAELVRLVRAVDDAWRCLDALKALLKPSPALAAARASLGANAKRSTLSPRNIAREMKRVHRALVKALKPFGEVSHA